MSVHFVQASCFIYEEKEKQINLFNGSIESNIRWQHHTKLLSYVFFSQLMHIYRKYSSSLAYSILSI